MDFNTLLTIIDGIKKLCDASKNIDSAYKEISGDGSGKGGAELIANAIKELDSDVRGGFKSVVDELKIERIQENWHPISASLDEIYNTAKQRIDEFGKLTRVKSKSGNHYIYNINYNDTFTVEFKEWCVGFDRNKVTYVGVFSELSKFIGPIGYKGPNDDKKMVSLDGMFTQLVTGPSILEVWNSAIGHAQESSSAAPIFEKYKNRTQYNLCISLMAEIYSILGMLIYVHDGAKMFLSSIDGKQRNDIPFLLPTIKNLFGSVSAFGTVWADFRDQLDSISDYPKYSGKGVVNIDPKSQIRICSMSCDENTSHPQHYDQSLNGILFVVTAPCTLTDNKFFSAIRIKVLRYDKDHEVNCYPVIVLEGRRAEIGSNLEIIQERDYYSALVQPGVQAGGWDQNIPGLQGWVWQPAYTVGDKVHSLYTRMPEIKKPKNNDLTVVTGFQFIQNEQNGLGVALQYGQLIFSKN